MATFSTDSALTRILLSVNYTVLPSDITQAANK